MVAVWVVMVLTALGVAGSGFFGCFNPRLGEEGGSALSAEVLVVEGRPVTLGRINAQIEQFLGQFGGAGDPDIDYPIMSSVLSTVIDQQIMANMAAQRGVTITEEQIISSKSDEIDAAIRQFRLAAVTQADLKETATEAEFQKYFEEKNGESTAVYKDRILSEVREQLKKPEVMQGEVDRYSAQALQESFFATTKVSDEEAKRSFEKLMMLRLTFEDQEMGLSEREALAAKALAELDAGADFKAVQRKYMKNPITDATKYALPEIERNPTQRPLAALKAGEHSKVITEFGIPTIYKLVERKSELPSDFEANKSIHVDTVRRDKASVDLQKAIETARKTAKIVWKSPGFEAMYRTQQIRSTEGVTDDQIKTALLDLLNSPPDTSADPAGPRPGILARYGAMKQLEQMVTVDERKTLVGTFIEVLNETLSQYEHTPLRLDLVDLYVETGDKDGASNELFTAAQMNSGFEEINKTYFSEINTKLTQLEAKGMISDEKALEIREVLAKWSLEKSQAEEFEKQAKAELDKFNVDPKTGKPPEEPKPTTTGGTTGKGN
jgi:hypothetical protein